MRSLSTSAAGVKLARAARPVAGMRSLSTSAAGFKLVETSTRGRALVATRAFAVGERIFRERPIALFDPTAPQPHVSESSPLHVRLGARLPLGPLRAACAAEGVRYPLLVAHMLLRSLTASVAGVGGPSFESFWESVALLHGQVPAPAPARWAEQYALLRAAFCAPEARIRGAEQLFGPGVLDEAWFAHTLAALHANLVRPSAASPELLALFSIGSMLNHDCEPNLEFCFDEGAEAPPAGGRPDGATAGPDVAGVAEFVAARAIRAGEELTMPYVSPIELLPAEATRAGPRRPALTTAQRSALQSAHGFDCDSCACPSRARY